MPTGEPVDSVDSSLATPVVDLPMETVDLSRGEPRLQLVCESPLTQSDSGPHPVLASLPVEDILGSHGD